MAHRLVRRELSLWPGVALVLRVPLRPFVVDALGRPGAVPGVFRRPGATAVPVPRLACPACSPGGSGSSIGSQTWAGTDWPAQW
ncbi:hypothetical protein WJ438_01000 [Streptomyces sp. GD-15H]|uniref:hypothetical protein n=1 Tax=Streptomyces sp. GD-15H TaxID=3129112 RepID=UPI00325143A9